MNSLTLARTIQRLVDGEIDDRERDNLLAHAEQHQEVYRTIALSYVEQAIWDEGLKPSRPDRPSATTQSTAEMGRADTSNRSSGCDGHYKSNGHAKSRRMEQDLKDRFRHVEPLFVKRSQGSRPIVQERTPQVSRWTLVQLTSGILAAAILIGCAGAGIGWWMAERSSALGTRSDRLASHDYRASADSLSAASNDRSNHSVLNRTPSTNVAPSGPFPLVRPVGLTLPSDLQMQLLRSGFVVEEQFNYVDVELDSGQSVPVPVNELRVNYFGNRLYQ